MKPTVDKEIMRKARLCDRTAEAVGRVCGRLSISILGEPDLYHSLDASEKEELDGIRDRLNRLTRELRARAKDLRNDARGGII